MTPSRSLVAVVLAAMSLAAAPAFAQDASRTTATPDRDMQRRAAFDRNDANKDGFVDRTESRAASDAIFDRLDVNRDGRLTTDELTFSRRTRSQTSGDRSGNVNTQTGTTAPTDSRRTRADRLLQRLDSDKDGSISRGEWQASGDMRFDRCDTNKDGRLAFDECRMTQARTMRRPTVVQ